MWCIHTHTHTHTHRSKETTLRRSPRLVNRVCGITASVRGVCCFVGVHCWSLCVRALCCCLLCWPLFAVLVVVIVVLCGCGCGCTCVSVWCIRCCCVWCCLFAVLGLVCARTSYSLLLCMFAVVAVFVVFFVCVCVCVW